MSVLEAQRQVTEFFNTYPSRDWTKGQIIVHAYDEPKGVYFVESGCVRQYAISAQGDEVVINVFRSSSFVPMSWAMSNHANQYFYDVIEDSKLRCAPKGDVVAFVEQHPVVMQDLLERVYSGLDGLMMRMVHLMSSSAHVRLMHELVILAQRSKPAIASSSVLIPVRGYQLAQYTGLTPETVSREMKVLKDKQLVEVGSNGITIGNVKEFEDELQSQL